MSKPWLALSAYAGTSQRHARVLAQTCAWRTGGRQSCIGARFGLGKAKLRISNTEVGGEFWPTLSEALESRRAAADAGQVAAEAGQAAVATGSKLIAITDGGGLDRVKADRDHGRGRSGPGQS